MTNTKRKRKLSKTGIVILVILPLIALIGLIYFGFNHTNLFNNSKDKNEIVSKNDNSPHDTEKPIITSTTDIFRTKVGEEVDLLKDVSVTDNSNENLIVSISGEYNFGQSGTYNLEYTATDSSGNKATKPFTLKVYNDGINLDLTKLINGNYETFTTSKGYEGIILDNITYIEGFIIANKTYSVPKDYGTGLENETQEAFNKLVAAAKLDGININIQSGFRSYDTQSRIYNRHVTTYSQAEADTYSARPGHSEHQTGTAMDLNWINEKLEERADGKWLFANAYKYGFILRYPKGKDNETGYMYEPWHYRYVGPELAQKLYNNGDWITLESYFGITSIYQ